MSDHDVGNWLGHRGTVAALKAGCKPGWRAFKIEMIGKTKDALIHGGVPSGHYKTGASAGRQKWSKPYDVVCVSEMELRAEETRYEAETGNCAACEGRGEVFASWSAVDGTKTKTCAKCGGRKTADVLLAALAEPKP